MILRTLALFLAASALAACAAGDDRPRNANPASEMAPPGQDPGRVAGSTAEDDCLFAVATQVGVDENAVWLIESSMGENVTIVRVGVPGAQAPWVCEWGGDGVAGVYYGGSEGAL